MPPRSSSGGRSAGGASGGNGKYNLMHAYFVYSAILAIKLLFLKPMASLVCNPEKVSRANLSDLKNLTPFWLLAALYMTTSPDPMTAVTLLRIFVLARFIAAFGYIYPMPCYIREWAFFLSFAVSCFMGCWVAYTYRHVMFIIKI